MFYYTIFPPVTGKILAKILQKLKWESQQIASFNGKVDQYRLTPSVRIIWEAVPTRPPIQTLLLSPMHNSALTLTCLRSQLWSRPKQTRVMLMFWQHLTLTFHENVNMNVWNKINSFLVIIWHKNVNGQDNV